MKIKNILLAVVALSFLFSVTLRADTKNVIDDLKDGNTRFAKGALLHPHQDVKRRVETAVDQRPKAIVLSCSDSRVPPEIIFDQGVGDLFVVRVAGNTLNNENFGSIIYAMEHFHIKDVIVLGHKRCGAVAAAFHEEGIFGRVRDIINPIKRSVKEAKAQKCQDCDIVELASHLNVIHQVDRLHTELRANAVGAYYDPDTGRVEFLDQK